MFLESRIAKPITYLLMISVLLNTGLGISMSFTGQMNKTTDISMVNQEKKIRKQIVTVTKKQSPPEIQMVQPNKLTGVGNKSRKVLLSNTNYLKTSISDKQYQILVRLIHAEAGGEPLKGQVAVAAVILNRTRSGKFPKSISANVFRNGEFESVSNGYIWSNDPPVTAYKAAKLALQGWDPTYGSLYFYNPAKTISNWIWSRPIYTKIGRHYFAG